LSEILAMIRESSLPEPVKERASAVFQRLGEAEAKIHDVPVEAIHFHEVGAVDSIIDIVGSVLGLHLLGVERIVCSPLPAGHGFVRAAHGLMPIPAPATMELLKGIPVYPVDVEGELVTPTGAALMASLADEFGRMPPMRVETIGYGAGKKEFPFPNLLRVCIGMGE
jgi:pyridinium-3,5-bisthiocarboxylic acid mononucleotide nickel chelatase